MKTKQITQAAILIAFVFIVTRFIQIPIPAGYFNVGNVVILISCLLLPSPYGLIIGAAGAGLADLTSYPVYTIPTLIIKALMALVFYKMMTAKKASMKGKDGTDENKKSISRFEIVAAVVATLIPLFGYTLTGCILYGWSGGIVQFPGLLAEYVVNIVLFTILKNIVKKVNLRNI